MATKYTGEVIPLEETAQTAGPRKYTGEVVPLTAETTTTPSYDPTAGMSTTEKFTAGMGKAMVDIGRGIGQRLGLVSQEDIEEARRLDEPLMRTGAGQAGTIAGGIATAAPTMLIPGAGTIPGAIALGSAFGAAQPTTKEESVAANIATGGAFGLGGALAPRALSRVISPKATERVKKAVGELTPGQALGGWWKQAEEKAASLPIAGYGINKAQKEAVESFNKGILDHVLSPLGEKVNKIGREGITEVSDKLSKAYDDLLPKLKITVDNAFDAEMKNLRDMASNLAEPEYKQFEKILGPKGVAGRHITPYGKMSGESMKTIDSILGQEARGYSSSSKWDERKLGAALHEAQASLRDLVERQNPKYAKELKAINTGWAGLVRLENAAGRIGAKEGIFTPAQLLQATRATDTSLRHRQFSRGNAMFQDIAEETEKLIGNKYSDSGTAGRLGMTDLLHYALKPAQLTTEAGLGLAYGIPGVARGMTAAVGKRPAVAARMAEKVRRLAPATAAVGAGTEYPLEEAFRPERRLETE